MVSLSLLKYKEKLLCSMAFCQSPAHQVLHAEHLQHAASFPHSSYYNINCGKVDLISNQLPARASPFLFMTEATSMPFPSIRNNSRSWQAPPPCVAQMPRLVMLCTSNSEARRALFPIPQATWNSPHLEFS